MTLNKFILPCLCRTRILAPLSPGTALGCGVQKMSMKEPPKEARLVFFSHGVRGLPWNAICSQSFAFVSLGIRKHLLPKDYNWRGPLRGMDSEGSIPLFAGQWETSQGSALNKTQLISLQADIQVSLWDFCWLCGDSCRHSALPRREENKPN